MTQGQAFCLDWDCTVPLACVGHMSLILRTFACDVPTSQYANLVQLSNTYYLQLER